jgi:dTDP-4-dehydrorhamnose reductase
LARALFAEAGVTADLTSIATTQWQAAARRPAYSVLAAEKYKRLGLPPVRPWQEALGAYLQERRRR